MNPKSVKTMVLLSLADDFWELVYEIISAAGELFDHFEAGNAIF